jgi:hypothetical protein
VTGKTSERGEEWLLEKKENYLIYGIYIHIIEVHELGNHKPHGIRQSLDTHPRFYDPWNIFTQRRTDLHPNTTSLEFLWTSIQVRSIGHTNIITQIWLELFVFLCASVIWHSPESCRPRLHEVASTSSWSEQGFLRCQNTQTTIRRHESHHGIQSKGTATPTWWQG